MYHAIMEISSKPPCRFGEALVELRSSLGLTQYKLAQLSGVSQRYLNYLEHGVKEPRATMIIKLALAMGITPGMLLDLMYEKTKKQ